MIHFYICLTFRNVKVKNLERVRILFLSHHVLGLLKKGEQIEGKQPVLYMVGKKPSGEGKGLDLADRSLEGKPDQPCQLGEDSRSEGDSDWLSGDGLRALLKKESAEKRNRN